MPKTFLRPSRRLRELVTRYDSVSAAAYEWRLAPVILARFLSGGGISGNTVAILIEQTGLDYDELFDIRHAAKK